MQRLINSVQENLFHYVPIRRSQTHVKRRAHAPQTYSSRGVAPRQWQPWKIQQQPMIETKKPVTQFSVVVASIAEPAEPVVPARSLLESKSIGFFALNHLAKTPLDE